MHVHLYFDGSTKPSNPGPSTCAAILCDPQTGETLTHIGKAIGTATNNVAEYNGLYEGLCAARELGATHVSVFGDSKLVINQIWGNDGCYSENLIPLNKQVKALLAEFTHVEGSWIPRERNTAADALCERLHAQSYQHDGAPSADARTELSFVVTLRVSNGVADDRSKRTALGKALRTSLERAFPLATVDVARISG